MDIYLAELPTANLHTDHVPQKLANRRERAMTDPLQIADQGCQPWADQAGPANVIGYRGHMSFVAIHTKTLDTAMFSDLDRLQDEFDLLQDALEFLAVLEFAAAIGTARIIVIEILIDFGRFERRALVPGMAELSAAFAFG